MREKIKSHKILVITVAVIVLIIAILIFIINMLGNKSSDLGNIIDKNDEFTNELNSDDKKNELEELMEDKGEESANGEEKNSGNTPKTNNDGNSNQTSSNNNTQTNVSTDDNENNKISNSNPTTSTNSNSNTDTNTKSDTSTDTSSNTTNTNTTESYIGVPNPNDFYYSYHHGVIDYKVSDYPNQDVMQVCVNDAIRISLKDTVDIINTNCIDVMDGVGTLLGEYLYINCTSGNCDKYKD